MNKQKFLILCMSFVTVSTFNFNKNRELDLLHYGNGGVSKTVSDYLIKYGYLSAINAGDSSSVQTAIHRLQEDMNRLSTGVLDPFLIDLMSKPRCGNQWSDPNTRREIGWNTSEITWDLSRTWYPHHRFTYERTVEVLQRAAAVWQRALPFLTIKRVDHHRYPNIMISFIKEDRYKKFDGPGGSYGHAFSPNVEMYRGGIAFDFDENWTEFEEGENTRSLYDAAVHEFGHALGLEHNGRDHSIMSPIIRIKGIDVLPRVDIEAVQRLYKRFSNTPPVAVTPTHTETTTDPPRASTPPPVEDTDESESNETNEEEYAEEEDDTEDEEYEERGEEDEEEEDGEYEEDQTKKEHHVVIMSYTYEGTDVDLKCQRIG